MYIDNVMDSVTDLLTPIKLLLDLTELFALAGMRIHKWCSNETAILEDNPEDDRVTDVYLENNQSPIIKTLGVLRQSNDDVLYHHQLMKSLQKEKWQVLWLKCSTFSKCWLHTQFVLRQS